MSKGQHKESFLAPLWRANPLLIGLLGMCPALAVTKTLEASFGMGILFTIVLVCSNVLISALRKIIPDEVKTPSYIVVIATFVTLVKMFAEAFLPELYSTLGVFVSLLVVNCIVLGRAEAFASKNTVVDSLLDGIGNGIGYTLAICMIGLIREVLGSGRITFGATFTFIADLNGGNKFRIPLLRGEGYDFSMNFFSTPAGGFLVLGIVLAVIMAINNHKTNKAKVDARIAAKKAKEEAASLAAKEVSK